MATTLSNTQNGTDDSLPGAWERVDDEELPHAYTEAYEHKYTGLRVTIEAMSRPTQMSDPRTASMDSGFIARVRDIDDVGSDLCHELSQLGVARDTAREFVEAHPDGGFTMPSDDERHAGGPINWRDN